MPVQPFRKQVDDLPVKLTTPIASKDEDEDEVEENEILENDC